MDILYLAIQHTYTDVQAGLYKNNQCLSTLSLHKHLASSLLVERIKDLLAKHTINLGQLSFLAVNQGPGPFTTLRVVIATVNGLSFALGIPLVGIDGIKTLVNEYTNKECKTYVALLNAFNQDVYFAIKESDDHIKTGYENIEILLKQLKAESKESSLCFLGNGATLHCDLIKKYFPDAFIDQDLHHCSLNALASQGLHKWQNKHCVSTQLQPLYLKNILYKTSNIAK